MAPVSVSNVLGFGASIGQAERDGVYEGKVAATYSVSPKMTSRLSIPGV